MAKGTPLSEPAESAVHVLLVPEALWQLIVRQAEEAGMPVSQYLTWCVKQAPPPRR